MPQRGVTGDLFGDPREHPKSREELAPGAVLLRGFANEIETELSQAIEAIAREAPFRHMTTPGGYRMSAAMTNCGEYGWVTDRRGYRYDRVDPESGRPWPALPPVLRELGGRAAAEAGYLNFVPDACLVNRYEPGARMSLHQDRDERDFAAPIVSLSLGLPAVFLFGGAERGGRARRVRVFHGDVAVWGGPSRLAFHGIAPLSDGEHPIMGRVRINLTLRRAG